MLETIGTIQITFLSEHCRKYSNRNKWIYHGYSTPKTELIKLDTIGLNIADPVQL